MQSSINNIYKLDGTVPIAKAIPFGLQHILAMFVSNLTPITLIATSAQPALTQAQIAILLQNAMFVAGIATLIQLYPIWKIGSRLPVVMGVSFTFVTVLSTVAANYGYPAVIGAVMIGGIMEGTLGLLAKYWRKIITPVVAASVVTSIGFSLFTVGARSFGGGYNEDFGSAQNLLLGTITLAVCLLWNVLSKGYLKCRSGSRIHHCHFYGKSRPWFHLIRRTYFPSSSVSCKTGIPCGSHCFHLHYLPGIRGGDHRRYFRTCFFRTGP